MGKNLAGLAIIASGINAFLVVYACGQLFASPEHYTSYGVLTFFAMLIGIPLLAGKMKEAATPGRYFAMLTVLVFGPLLFSMLVHFAVFPFQHAALAILSAIAFYFWAVWAHLHSP